MTGLVDYELDGGAARITLAAPHRGNPLDPAMAADLVRAVHPDDELDDAVERVVTTLLVGSRTAQVAAKRLLREVAVPWEEGALRRETLSIRSCAAGPDGREGVAAFVAKRRPDFPSAEDPCSTAQEGRRMLPG